MFNRYHITAENEEQNDEIHNLFIQLGYTLCEDLCSFKDSATILACGDGSMGNTEPYDDERNYEKINIEQLRDLVKLFKNELKGEAMKEQVDYICGEVIDGKTAFNAWYDGETVLVKYHLNDWKEFNTQDGYSIDVFKSKNHKFMIKPKTIMIGNIEVPAPYEPKEGEKYWHITTDEVKGYWWNNELDRYAQFGAWRTEDEIKQVVAALRVLLKGEQ